MVFNIDRENCTPNQKLACFVLSQNCAFNSFLEKYFDYLKANCLRNSKWHCNFSRPSSSWVIDQNISFDQFCRSQLLNLAHTRRVTGVKLIMECLWTAERFAIFQLFLIYFSEIFWRHSCMILLLITYFKRKLFQFAILLQILILFASSFTPKAIFHSGE